MSKAKKDTKPATPAPVPAPVEASVKKPAPATAAPDATTAPVVPVVSAPVVPVYVVGKVPSLGTGNMHNTKRTWDFLAAHLVEHGPQTVVSLQSTAKAEYNHASFVKYAVKNGWYVATTLEAEQAKAEAALLAQQLAAQAKVEAAAAADAK